MSYELTGIELTGSWEHICSFKARFIQNQWESSNIPIVWLDADATLEAYPEIFAHLNCDLGIYKFPSGNFATGTIYFGKSPLAKKLIDRWVFRCTTDPYTWDEISLRYAWYDINKSLPLKSVWLPTSYLSVFDNPYLAVDNPVVMHWQASRTAENHDGDKQFKWSARHFVRSGKNLLQTYEMPYSPVLSDKLTIDQTDQLKTFFKNNFIANQEILELKYPVSELSRFFDPSLFIACAYDPEAASAAKSADPETVYRLFEHGMVPSIVSQVIFNNIRHDEITEIIESDLYHTIFTLHYDKNESIAIRKTIEDANYFLKQQQTFSLPSGETLSVMCFKTKYTKLKYWIYRIRNKFSSDNSEVRKKYKALRKIFVHRIK